MEDEIVQKARELLDNPEMIIDLYDFSVVWMSKWLKEQLGYTKDEMIGKPIMGAFALREDKKRAKAVEHMSKEHGFMKVGLKAKNGDVIKFDVEFCTTEFKGGFYHIGRKLKYERIPKGK
jgi:hypothetical protein